MADTAAASSPSSLRRFVKVAKIDDRRSFLILTASFEQPSGIGFSGSAFGPSTFFASEALAASVSDFLFRVSLEVDGNVYIGTTALTSIKELSKQDQCLF